MKFACAIRIRHRISTAGLLCLLLVLGAPALRALEWYDPDWQFRKRITVDSARIDEDLTDFPLRVHLDEDEDIGISAREDGYDIRFTASDGETLLKYEREDFAVTDEKASGNFWVKIPSVASEEDTDFFIYYGNPEAADGEESTEVWDGSYEGVWHKDDLNASSIADSTANENDGNKKGADEPVEADGIIGKAQQYDGSDYVRIPSFNALNGRSEATISMWVNQNTNSTSNYLLWANGNVLIELGSSGGATNLRVRWSLEGTWRNDHSVPNILDTNNWHMWTITFDSGTTKIYKNGAEIYSGSDTQTAVSTSSPNYDIGFRSGQDGIDGLIDEVRICSTARSAAWIKADYHSGNDDLITFDPQETDAAVLTRPADNIKLVSARLHGELLDMQGEDSVYVWFKWRESGDGSWNETAREEKTETGAFSADMAGLDPVTEYEFKALTSDLDDQQEESGSVRTFNTLRLSVQTSPATERGETSARLNGEIIDTAGESEVLVWLEWREEDTGAWTATAKQTIASGAFHETLSGLDNEQLYEFRAHIATTAEEHEETGGILQLALPKWWDSAWNYRKLIVIDHTRIDEDLTDFPVRVHIDEDADVGSAARPDGYDIRFTDFEGHTAFKYEREDFDMNGDEASGNFWVKIPLVSSTEDTEFYMYYGNPSADDGQAPAEVWDDNFLAVWHKNDLTASSIADSTANDNHGAKEGADRPMETEGKIGMAQQYDGAGDNVVIDSDPSHDVTDSLTVSFWAKWNSSTGQHDLIVKDYQTRVFAIYMFSATSLRFWAMSGSSWIGTGHDVSFTPDIGQWHHIVGTRDAVQQRLYIDNVMQYEVTHGDGNLNTGSNITFGGGGYDYFDGLLDEIRISNTARCAAWVQAEFHSGCDTLLSLGDEEIRYIQPHHITVTGPAGPVTAGEISGPFTITVRGGSGEKTVMEEDAAFRLSSDSPTAIFYADANGQEEIEGEVTISTGEGSAQFYYKDSRAGASAISVEWVE